MHELKTPEQTELPSPSDMLAAYMNQAYQNLALMFEALNGIARLAQDRPELQPSLVAARQRIEEGYLWLQNGASGLDKIFTEQEEKTDEKMSDK